MKIIVLMKQVPDTYEERRLDPATGILDRAASEPIIDEIRERALETALRYKDANKGTEIVLLSMGPASVTAALRKGLSLGADRRSMCSMMRWPARTWVARRRCWPRR